MNYLHTEKALIQMEYEIRESGISAYKGDYLRDRIFLAEHEPTVFIWVIRESGTHIYPLDERCIEKRVNKTFHDHLRNVIASLTYHKTQESVLRVYGYYHGDSALLSIDEAITLAKSYLPAGAATRVVRNND